MELNGTILKILKEYYTDDVAYIKIGNGLSDPIEVTKGFRHGCSLSPILFIFIWKNLWTIERSAAKEWECQSKKISARFS